MSTFSSATCCSTCSSSRIGELLGEEVEHIGEKVGAPDAAVATALVWSTGVGARHTAGSMVSNEHVEILGRIVIRQA